MSDEYGMDTRCVHTGLEVFNIATTAEQDLQ